MATKAKLTKVQPQARPAAMHRRFPALVQIGVLVAGALSLWGAVSYFNFETTVQNDPQNRDPYVIQGQFVRFAELKQAIPPNAVLGYITNAEPGSTLAETVFDSVQYALAPRLLEKGTAPELVLGNFVAPVDFQNFGSPYGLHLERNFGNGVVLYRREKR